MSVRTQILVTRDTATSAINRFTERFGLRRVQGVVGLAVERMTKRHLNALPSNKRGWPSTGFYKDAANATSWQPVPEGVLLRVDKIGMRQRYFGGTIRPDNARALTIPINPVAYGHKASEFPGLFMLKTKTGAYLVQPGQQISEKSGRMIKLKNGGGNRGARLRASLLFLFKLSGGVTQQADPNVMPSKEALMKEAKDAILERTS